MENLKNKVFNWKLRANKNKLHQTDARNFKVDLHELFKKALESLDYVITDVENGFIIEVENDELGGIAVEAKFVIKTLDFDIESANAQYLEKLNAQKERLEKKKTQ